VTAPVIVAGGGLAGAAAAALLARAGRPVTVFEREAAPVDKICGEFISAEALGYLDHIGLDVAALGGHAISRFRLVRGRSIVACALPFTALGLSRRVLDEALLRHSEACGAAVLRGSHLRFLPNGDHVDMRDDTGEVFAADSVFLATGKHESHHLRRRVSGVPDLVGLKLHMRLTPAQQDALSGHVEILLLRHGYAGLQLVENGMANLCLLVSHASFIAAGGTLPALLLHLQETEPHLALRLAGHVVLSERLLSIARVPYGFVHRPRAADPKNLFRLGDQMGVIPSFTGDGMSIALHSAVVAASCQLAGKSAAMYHRRMRADIARQVGFADRLYRVSTSATARSLLMQLAGWYPSGLRLAARLTRVSENALARATLPERSATAA
jgi:flavin-dependent dehydrogenase